MRNFRPACRVAQEELGPRGRQKERALVPMGLVLVRLCSGGFPPEGESWKNPLQRFQTPLLKFSRETISASGLLVRGCGCPPASSTC